MEIIHVNGSVTVQIGQQSQRVFIIILLQHKVVGESFWEAGQYNFPIAKGLLYDIRMFCQGSRAIRTGINLTENGCPKGIQPVEARGIIILGELDLFIFECRIDQFKIENGFQLAVIVNKSLS